MHQDLTCPLGHTCARCLWWRKRTVADKAEPSMLREVEQCEISWIADLAMEGAIQTFRAGAGIESFRNEMVSGNAALADVLAIGMSTARRITRDDLK